MKPEVIRYTECTWADQTLKQHLCSIKCNDLSYNNTRQIPAQIPFLLLRLYRVTQISQSRDHCYRES